MKFEFDSGRALNRAEFAMALFPKNVSSAAMTYISSVGLIAIQRSKIPGVIDDPDEIVLSDTPQTESQKAAHQRLANYIAEIYKVSPEELIVAKNTILEACDPWAADE